MRMALRAFSASACCEQTLCGSCLGEGARVREGANETQHVIESTDRQTNDGDVTKLADNTLLPDTRDFHRGTNRRSAQEQACLGNADLDL